jgi:AAA+ superfamily predicted ATPase
MILGRKEPLLYLITHEEARAEAAVQAYCEHHEPLLRLFRWSSTRGLEKMQRGVVESVKVPEHADPRIQAQAPLVPVLNYIVNDCQDDGVFLLRDVHPYLRESSAFNPAVALTIRALREAFYELRSLRKARKLVLLSCEAVIPADLENEVRIFDFPLPTKDELATTVRAMNQKAIAIRGRDKTFTHRIADEASFVNRMVNSGLGLTQFEMEYIMENMLYADRRLDDDSPRRVTREKQQIIRKSGVLEFIAAEDMENLEVGGMEVMLEWLKRRKYVFLNEVKARECGIKHVPRGVLLLGISGCGKSLVCKSIAHEWGLPLLRLDMGAIFDKFVGASEGRIRKALHVAESVSPCILWLDELEKGFSTSQGGDGGTSQRVLGTFLVWMQEKKAAVFIAATANDVSCLPPELLRSGRFDNRFFVGCPGDKARADIFAIHLRANGLVAAEFDMPQLVEESFGYTGAEIEQSVIDSVYDAFYENRGITTGDITRNLRRNRPLVKSLGPQMAKILQMLDEGRMELASADTVSVADLVDRLNIQIK